MRQRRLAAAVLLSAAFALSGCNDVRNTGDVGHKNLRPYYANDYDKHGIRINGIYSPNSPTYRTRFASDQANERNRWMGGDGLGNNIVGRHDNYLIETNGRIAAELARLPEVDSAYVVLADQSAYVGIIPSPIRNRKAGTTDLDPRLQDKVADHVKSMSPRTQNVYVSSNSDFLARMDMYARASAQGYPVQGYLTEFNALVERVFPGNARVAGSAGSSGPSGASGNGTDLSSDTGTDTGTERGDAFTGNYR